MYYINRRKGLSHETVDQFEDEREAFGALLEYRMMEPLAEYDMSDTPFRGWEDDKDD